MLEKPQRLGTLRALVILNLALLALLLIFGLAFDPTTAAGKSPSGFSTTKTVSVLEQAGAASFIHMGLGILVGLLSIANMVLSFRSGIKNVKIFGPLAFLAILSAGVLGLFFVFSGFQNTKLILGLVPLFVLAVISNFLELFYLKAPSGTQPG